MFLLWEGLDDKLINVSIAGFLVVVFLISITKLVQVILDSRKNGKQEASVAGHSTDFWVMKGSQIVSESLKESVIPILNKQTEILDRLSRHAEKDNDKLDDIHADVKRGLRCEEP